MRFTRGRRIRFPWLPLMAGMALFLPSPGPLGTQTEAPRTDRNVAEASVKLPLGTVIPVSLNRGFSSKNSHAGQFISARVMQDVPIPGGGKIPAGSKVTGTILSVEPLSKGAARFSFRFDTLDVRHEKMPIVVSLRAIAGFVAVQFAQTPEMSPGFGTPFAWATTQQIGGDERYGVGGPVTDRESNKIGEAVYGGVLVHVRAAPAGGCRGALDGDDRPQAFWVFSSDACGVYGIEGLRILHAGRIEPLGETSLGAEDREIVFHTGTGLLLRVVR